MPTTIRNHETSTEKIKRARAASRKLKRHKSLHQPKKETRKKRDRTKSRSIASAAELETLKNKNANIPILKPKYKLEGHSKQITTSIITETGVIITASDDGTICIWREGKCASILREHKDKVKGLCLFKQKWLVSASSDKTLRVWALTGKYVKALEGHDLAVLCVTSLNDNYVVSGSSDRTCRIWNLKTAKTTKTLKGHTQPVECVCTGKKYIISGSHDKLLKMWNQQGKCLATLRGHTDIVTCCAIVGSTLYSGSQDNTIRIWNLSSKDTIYTIKKHRFWIMDLSVRGELLLTASVDQSVRLWDRKSYDPLAIMKCGTEVMCCGLNENNIVAAGQDGAVRVFSKQEVEPRPAIFPGTHMNMEGENATSPKVWDELFQRGVTLEQLGEFFQEPDVLLFATKASDALLQVVERHQLNMNSRDERVRSMENDRVDLWRCAGSRTNFMKFPTSIIFSGGDQFDKQDKVCLFLPDQAWCGSVPEGSGGAVHLYIYSKETLERQRWFSKARPFHDNACKMAFGSFPTGPYLRGEFTMQDGELDFMYNNSSLYPFPVDESSIEMPIPLQNYLRRFWALYESGLLPNEKKNIEISTSDSDPDQWFEYRKQLRLIDIVQLSKYEERYGPIHPDLYEIRQKQREQINKLNRQMTELEENVLDVKCKYKKLLESHKRDSNLKKRNQLLESENRKLREAAANSEAREPGESESDTQKEMAALKKKIEILSYKNYHLEKNVQSLVETADSEKRYLSELTKKRSPERTISSDFSASFLDMAQE